jgi:hypothetical protein
VYNFGIWSRGGKRSWWGREMSRGMLLERSGKGNFLYVFLKLSNIIHLQVICWRGHKNDTSQMG